MAGARITLEAKGEPLVLEALARLRDAGRRMKPVFSDVGEYLLQSHDERWDRQESPDGVPWAPLSERYAARKRAKGKSPKILVLDQHLKNLVYRTTDDELAVGTPWVYGATHQFGDESRGIPARPFLGLTHADRAEVLTLLSRWLSEEIAQ